MKRRRTELIREGRYATEVDIEPEYDERAGPRRCRSTMLESSRASAWRFAAATTRKPERRRSSSRFAPAGVTGWRVPPAGRRPYRGNVLPLRDALCRIAAYWGGWSRLRSASDKMEARSLA